MLLPQGWYVVASSRQVRPNEKLAIRRFGLDLVLWRTGQGQPVLMEDRCPHRSVRLSAGSIKSDRIICGFHGFEFDSAGVCQMVPETRKPAANLCVKKFRVQEKHGFIWANTAETGDDNELPWFSELADPSGFCHGELVDTWSVHITRCIENQLDYAHLPFVHRTTIGGSVDPSKKVPFSLTPESISTAIDAGGFHFIFPCMWLLTIKKGSFYQLIAFVPVDDETTCIYLRAYQNFVTIPLFEKLVGKIMDVQNKIILNQDKAIVLTHDPKSSIEAPFERLYPSDAGIQWFRKRWQEKTGVSASNV